MLSFRTALVALTLAMCCGWLSSSAHAQVLPTYEGFQPLSQHSSTGLAARFAEVAGRTGYIQPVRFVLDGEAQASIFYGPQVKEAALGSPAQVGLMVGHMYRIKVTNLPDKPGIEIFPTIELIDRLHPPAGQRDNFPVPVNITLDDVELALAGNLVTRVVYVEQPQIAAPYELDRTTVTQNLQKLDNAVVEADRRGRPIAIVRIGGRLPATHGEHPSFYGSGGPIMESKPRATETKSTEEKSAQATARRTRQ